MTDRYDDFERRLASDLQAYADRGVTDVDPYAVADRALASGRRRPAVPWLALVGGGAVLVGAGVIGLSFAGWRDDRLAGVPSVPPSATAQTQVSCADVGIPGYNVSVAVLVYFSCPDVPPPSVAAVVRPADANARLEEALVHLVRGPTGDERARGYTSWFSSETAGMLESVSVEDGHVIASFRDLRPIIPNASTSNGARMLLAELNATVLQFDDVQSVEYRLEGSCDAFWTWLQSGSCQIVQNGDPPIYGEATAQPPSPSASPCATDSCLTDLPIHPGQLAEVLVDGVALWSAPGEGEPEDVELPAGRGVHVAGTRLVVDEGWYRVQVPLNNGAGEWVYAWIPGTVDGSPTLGLRSQSHANPLESCAAQDAGGWVLVAGTDPIQRVTCGSGVSVTLDGYLGEAPHTEEPIFSGEPAWLANEPELVLWSAIGPAADGFMIPLHIDPESGVAYPDGILSDREATEGTRVYVAGHFADAASDDCRREPRVPGFLPMTAEEQVLWCRQQFVVDQIHVGEFIEPDLADLDTCENPDDGYRISFPDAWYSNTEYDEIGGCRFFNPGPFAVTPGEEAAGVAITVEVAPGDVGYFDHMDGLETLTVAGRPARRFEVRGAMGEGGMLPPWVRIYTYVVQLTDVPEGGLHLVIETSNGSLGDYDTNRAVLDAMVQTLELTRTE